MDTDTLKNLFSEQKKSLEYFFENINLSQVHALTQVLSKVKGTIFLTGVGKSGFIAQKITASLVSLGIKSYFLAPIDALHGDLGIVDQDDVVLFFSKSGESEELLNLIPFIRNRGAERIAIVSNTSSRLAKACDYLVHLPMTRELCPYDVVPTTSTEIQLLFGDVLALALMEEKKLSLDEFAKNHPGGRIGKRLSIRVEDLMLKKQSIPLCTKEDRLSEVLEELTVKRCGCVLIVNDDKQLEGIFTDGDLRRALEKYGREVFDLKMGDLKTNLPKTIHPEKMAWEAMQLMESDQKKPIMVLPVINQEKVVQGLIKMHDILQSGLS